MKTSPAIAAWEIESCGAQLYEQGGWYDSNPLEGLVQSSPCIRPLAQLFPAFAYERPTPFQILASTEFEATLRASYDTINQVYRNGAASWLVELTDVVLYRSVLYVQGTAGRRILYETYRPPDRADSPLLEPVTPIVPYPSKPNTIRLHLGSVGSFNYGHWLTDDVARLAAITQLRKRFPRNKIDILVPSYGDTDIPIVRHWNEARRAAIEHFVRRFWRLNVQVTPIDVRCAYRLDSVFYVSPVSYHPVLKSPDSLRFVRERMQTNFNLRWRRKSARLFVTRHAARGRRLENLDALAQRFERLGFTVVDTERMSAVEQAALFSRAKVVVGVMGAAMTNTIFCASDARVIHFAPEGWLEPYYWDLASNLGHEYNACYGPPIRTEGPAHMTAFELPEHLVSKALTLAQ